jgi:hypothetical protein
MRLKRPISFKKRMRAKPPKRARKTPEASWMTSAGAIGIALVIVGMIAASLITSGRSSSPGPRTPVADASVDQSAIAPFQADAPAAGKVASSKPLNSDALVQEMSATRAEQKTALVTITGCLEQRGAETFRLKDASGTAVPASRTWKSGFLKKGPSTIEVVDRANHAKLPAHVGQRVSVTGVLVDREMRVSTLQRIASSCNKNPSA